MPSALELTPEKFHDFLSLTTSSPSLLNGGSPEAVTKLETTRAEDLLGTPPPPSFAQVSGNIVIEQQCHFIFMILGPAV